MFLFPDVYQENGGGGQIEKKHHTTASCNCNPPFSEVNKTAKRPSKLERDGFSPVTEPKKWALIKGFLRAHGG